MDCPPTLVQRAPNSRGFTGGEGWPNIAPTTCPRRLPVPLAGTFLEAVSNAKFSSQKTYERIRQKILDFELFPGTRITETELADEFQVSRTPVRAALQRLSAEGHITILPKQGCFVRPMDAERISQYYDVRVGLEAEAIEMACRQMPVESIDALLEIWNPANARKTQHLDEIRSLEEAFHISIAEGSGNEVLVGYLRDINDHIRILRRLGFPDRKAVLETFEEHHEMCQLISRRSADAARKAMIAHIRKSQEIARTVTLSQLQHAIRRGSAGC